MRKLTLAFSSLLFLFFTAFNANAISVGVSVIQSDFDGTGTEKVGGTNSNTGSASKSASYGSVFFESTPSDTGWVVGIDWIPGSATFVSESKTQTNVTDADSTTESLTQKVAADLDNHLTLYVEKDIYNGVYVMAGLIKVDVTTNESIGTGSTYPDDELLGQTYGIGYRYNMDNLFIKLEANISEYDDIELSATNTTNTVTGDFDATSGKISVGYSF